MWGPLSPRPKRLPLHRNKVVSACSEDPFLLTKEIKNPKPSDAEVSVLCSKKLAVACPRCTIAPVLDYCHHRRRIRGRL